MAAQKLHKRTKEVERFAVMVVAGSWRQAHYESDLDSASRIVAEEIYPGSR
jgi:hypothetical protein